MTVLFLVALILALVEEFRARGQSILAWAVAAIALGLCWDFIAGLLR